MEVSKMTYEKVQKLKAAFEEAQEEFFEKENKRRSDVGMKIVADMESILMRNIEQRDVKRIKLFIEEQEKYGNAFTKALNTTIISARAVPVEIAASPYEADSVEAETNPAVADTPGES
jgi:hypothetical protein